MIRFEIGNNAARANGRVGSEAVILRQNFRAAAMRRKAAPRLASWRPFQNGQKQPLGAAQSLLS